MPQNSSDLTQNQRHLAHFPRFKPSILSTEQSIKSRYSTIHSIYSPLGRGPQPQPRFEAKNRDFCNRNQLLAQLRLQARGGEAKIGENTENPQITAKTTPKNRQSDQSPQPNPQIFRILGSIPALQAAPLDLTPTPPQSRILAFRDPQIHHNRQETLPKFPIFLLKFTFSSWHFQTSPIPLSPRFSLCFTPQFSFSPPFFFGI